ncbi:MAG: alpha-1,2-fucosyltransferase, partial [Phascolarctobacterium sp.]|nr:alpha-1,2-fucosyltransferase [Candidatus Phascolarctobacterium equi]
NKYYGNPTSENYFIEAMKIIKAKVLDVRFFFFSDEMDYVRDRIVPFLDKDTNYSLCCDNGSDKGYLDLYLLTCCKHFICSKGSFGAFGRILSKNDGLVIVEKTNNYGKVLQENFKNVLLV